MKDAHFYEEEQFFQTKKERRHAKKLASKLDTSRYKKTDQKKIKTQNIAPKTDVPPHLVLGVVTCVRGQEILVQTEKTLYTCTIRGIFKKEKSLSKTAVIVGDRVFLEEHSGQEGVIVSIEKRERLLSRASHLSQKKEHYIAANVDLVFIITSVVDPPLRPAIIDRYLIAAEKGGLTPIIIVNKIDLLFQQNHEEQKLLLEECTPLYRSIGIPLIATSVETGEGLSELKYYMKNKISVFSGQSGSGKSSLINALCSLDLKVGHTVRRYKKGSHTTSMAQLLPLDCGGFVVDTPGIKSFGVWNLQKQDVKKYFSEINDAGSSCQFVDCQHQGEAGCAIPKAIQEGKVSSRRYESYLQILATLETKHLRR